MTPKEALAATVTMASTYSLGEEDAEAAIKALDAAGFVIVPKEPTPAMIEAAWASALDEDAAGVWTHMIEARPR